MERGALTRYLVKLATDPKEFKIFRKSRAAARDHMRDAGLTEDQIEAVLSKNSEEVHEAIIADSGDELQDIYRGHTHTCTTIEKFDDGSSFTKFDDE